MIEEFIQEFRRVARESRYKRRSLVEEFKRGIYIQVLYCEEQQRRRLVH